MALGQSGVAMNNNKSSADASVCPLSLLNSGTGEFVVWGSI